MNERFFLERIRRIEQYYNDKEFNDVQKEAWFEAFKNLNEAQFDYLIKQSFERFTFKPMLAQMIELKKEILANVKRTEKEMKAENEKCARCKSAGVIKYTRKINDVVYDYYARCTCKNSLNFLGLPLIDDVIEREKKKQYQKTKEYPKTENTQKQDLKKYLGQIGIRVNEK